MLITVTTVEKKILLKTGPVNRQIIWKGARMWLNKIVLRLLLSPSVLVPLLKQVCVDPLVIVFCIMFHVIIAKPASISFGSQSIL